MLDGDRASADDHAPRAARAAGAAPRRAARSARAFPRAASSRSLAASLPAARSSRASPTSRSRPGSPQPIVYGGVDTQELHHRGRRLRRRVSRLRQRRLAGPPRAERHAARGRAGRRDQSPLQEQPRRHVHRRHREGRPDAHRAGRRRSPSATTTTTASTTSSSPTTARTSCITTTATARSPTSPRRPACGRTASATAPAAPGSTTTATAASICSSRTISNTTLEKLPKPGENADCRWKGVPVNCGPRGLPPGFVQLFHNNGDGTFTDVSRAVGRRRGVGLVSDDRGGRRLRQRRLARHLRRLRLHAQLAVPQPARRHVPRGGARARRRAERRRHGAGGHGRRASATTISTATSTSSRRTSPTTPTSSTATTARATSTTSRSAPASAWRRASSAGARAWSISTTTAFPTCSWSPAASIPEVERTLPAYPFRTPRLVFRNLGDGRFEELIEEAGPGVAAAHTSRGCAFGDFDNDGDVDVLVMNMNEPPSLLRNDVSAAATG